MDWPVKAINGGTEGHDMHVYTWFTNLRLSLATSRLLMTTPMAAIVGVTP